MWCSRILVAYDGSAPSLKAIDLARSIGAQSESIEIVLAHVVKLFSSGAAAVGMDTVLIAEMDDVRDELNVIAESIPNPTGIVMLKGSSPADLLLRCAREQQCDLIVMGSRGKGGVKGYLGSVSYAVVQGSPVTVMIAKDGAQN